MKSIPTKILVIVILLIVAYSGCSTETPSQKIESLDLTFEQALVLPDTALAQDSVVFSFPARVRTGNGKIYVTDRDLKAVQVFDQTGKLINSMGRPGRGPGEFSDLEAMEMTIQNEIIVFDGLEDRINRFAGSGEFLTSIIPPQDGFTWPDKVRQLDAYRFLFLSRERMLPDAKNTPLQTSFLHIFDAGFENRLHSFGHIDSLMETETDFARVFSRSFGQGNITIGDDGSIWFVPILYEGRIFKFRPNGNGWSLTDTYRGQMIAGESHEEDYKQEGAVVINTYTPDGSRTFNALIKSESLGIYELSDGRMIHLNAQLVDTTRKVMAEVFNPKGKLQGVGELPGFRSYKSDTNVDITVAWKDEQDRFYIIDEEGAPTIRIGTISGL